jgi:hypothetical protein
LNDDIDDFEDEDSVENWADTEAPSAPTEPPHEPTIDPRALTMPLAVENPIVSKRDDRRWVNSHEAAFREEAFRMLYNDSFAPVTDGTLRFGLALVASCRPFRNGGLVPKKVRHRLKVDNAKVLAQNIAPSESVVAGAVAISEGPLPIPVKEDENV